MSQYTLSPTGSSTTSAVALCGHLLLKCVLLCATLLWSWLLGESASAESVRGQPYTVKVGAILPLSGELAHVGNDIREGITLALEEHANSTPIFKFVWEDSRFSMRDSVTAAKKLIAVDKVDVIISLWDTADVIAPLTDQHKVIHLSIRWNPDVAARHRFTFTFESTYHTFFRDVATLLKKEKITKVVFLSEDMQGGLEQLHSFQASCQQHGIQILAEASFPTGTTDFRSILTRLLSYKPQMVVAVAYPPANSTIIQTLRTLNPTMRHIGDYETIPHSPLLEGTPFVSQLGFLPDFSQKFEQRFGHPFRVRAPHGYELVRILAWAYRGAAEGTAPSAGKPATAAVVTKLEQLKEFPSILGPLSTSKTRNIEHPNTIKIMRNGKLVPYGE